MILYIILSTQPTYKAPG